jgi:CRISPR-associated protein (TIGR03984 family)
MTRTTFPATGAAGAVVAEFAGSHPQAIGWVETPTEAYWVRLDDGRLTRHGGIPDLDRAFEIKLFDRDAELRWWWVPDLATGRWAIVADSTVEDRGLAPLDGDRQLLWGRVAESQAGWVRLDDARIGSVWVPADASGPGDNDGDYALLKRVEYVQEFEFGNVAVVDARCVGLSFATGEQMGSKKEAGHV